VSRQRTPGEEGRPCGRPDNNANERGQRRQAQLGTEEVRTPFAEFAPPSGGGRRRAGQPSAGRPTSTHDRDAVAGHGPATADRPPRPGPPPPLFSPARPATAISPRSPATDDQRPRHRRHARPGRTRATKPPASSRRAARSARRIATARHASAPIGSGQSVGAQATGDPYHSPRQDQKTKRRQRGSARTSRHPPPPAVPRLCGQAQGAAPWSAWWSAGVVRYAEPPGRAEHRVAGAKAGSFQGRVHRRRRGRSVWAEMVGGRSRHGEGRTPARSQGRGIASVVSARLRPWKRPGTARPGRVGGPGRSSSTPGQEATATRRSRLPPPGATTSRRRTAGR